MDHDVLVERAKQAISAVFSNRSVDKNTTRESLNELASEIDIMIDAL
jgi:hypothetical protein